MLVTGNMPAQSGDLPLARPVALVIFDCDGVLIDSEVISNRMTVTALNAIGYPISEDAASRSFTGRSYASVRKDIESDWGQALPATFEADVQERVLDEMAISLEAVSGISDALARLHLARCVASSSSIEWITSGLRKTGLFDYLEPHFFSASMVENGKPAPDVFLHAAERMGVSPENALVIEDSVPGVQAGVAAGMTVIGFTGGSHITDKAGHGEHLLATGASLVTEDIRGLPDLITRRAPG
jgi:HAD superfamily hydrolase (TIGR01509 family)